MNSAGSPSAADQLGESPPRTVSGRPWHWLEGDEDEEDVDFGSEYGGYEDMDDDEDEDHYGNIHTEFSMENPDEGNTGEETEDRRHAQESAARSLSTSNTDHLRNIVHQSQSPRRVLIVSSDESEFGAEFGSLRRRRALRLETVHFPIVPSNAGTELMASGDFGENPYYVDELKKRKKSLAAKIMWRELGVDGFGRQRMSVQSTAQDLIPGNAADKIIQYDSRCYSGQFSDDGNFFFCCTQDFKVRMYDTSNPLEWKYYKTVNYPFGQWTITDACLSPDNKFLAYTSIRDIVCLAPTNPGDQSEPSLLDLSTNRPSPYSAIWSIRFSGDGREIVAGKSDNSVIVYDIETQQSILKLENHENDVNAVCFGDKSSPHILYSGSDDTTIRVWDRRSMGDGREAGVFIGHTEGITYIDSKGDGRYVLSNGKDQAMKLWDLRKMMTPAKLDTIDIHRYSINYDYRLQFYPEDSYVPHPNDCSVVTFRGHQVLKTLIRCHFSPPGSTNSRYVYTGSADGKVYVYNLDTTLAKTIDVKRATKNSRPRDPDIFTTLHGGRYTTEETEWKTCVRDASWHPNAPVLAAASFNGWGMTTGTCSIHSWNAGVKADEGSPPVGKSYDCELNYLGKYNDFRVHLVPQ